MVTYHESCCSSSSSLDVSLPTEGISCLHLQDGVHCLHQPDEDEILLDSGASDVPGPAWETGAGVCQGLKGLKGTPAIYLYGL